MNFTNRVIKPNVTNMTLATKILWCLSFFSMMGMIASTYIIQNELAYNICGTLLTLSMMGFFIKIIVILLNHVTKMLWCLFFVGILGVMGSVTFHIQDGRIAGFFGVCLMASMLGGIIKLISTPIPIRFYDE